ncbi:MAG: hypothetical protein C4530_10320 [Desulfobacteraceae bacterium]|nr:MAG: hypothetical protein C4530_10320 [Desulfobacteraceae bacterium]
MIALAWYVSNYHANRILSENDLDCGHLLFFQVFRQEKISLFPATSSFRLTKEKKRLDWECCFFDKIRFEITFPALMLSGLTFSETRRVRTTGGVNGL